MGAIPAPNIPQDVALAQQSALAAGQAPQNALQEYARTAALKQQAAIEQQQTQGLALQNQVQQQQLADQQAATKAMRQWDGQDMSEIPDLIRKNGGSYQAYAGAQQQVLQRQQMLSNLSKDQLQNLAAHHDAALGVISAHESVPDEQLYPSMTDAIGQLVTQGHLTQQEGAAVTQHMQSMSPDQFRPWLDVYKKSLMGEKEQAQQTIAQQEAAAKQTTAAADKERADTAAWEVIPQLGLRVNKVTGEQQAVQGAVMSPEMMQAKYVALAQKQASGQPLAPEDEAFMRGVEKYKSIVPTANINLQAGLLTPGAKQMLAQNLATTGQLPQGMGRSPGMISQVLNTAAGAPGGAPNLAASKQTYQANTGSLESLQKNFDQVTAFENTAGKNLDTFLGQAKKVIDSGSPWINTPLRAVDAGALGSGDQAAFNAARATALTEIAKVLNSSNASGVLSDSARQEVSQLIGPNATLKQIVAASNILKRDMENRRQSYQDQIDAVKGRTSGATQPNAGGGNQGGGAKFNVGDSVMYQGKPHKVTAVDPQTGKLTLAP